ncbi:MAG: hypothetical protein SVV03_02605 [Candidatus Nanohaloarchaea archaeon]|nr:hypothetical protein [Candidatus Nanohaloarchaea archaeon]
MPTNLEDLDEDQLEEILNSKMVQKYLAYRDLASGIEALKEDDVMYDQLVKGIEDKVRVKEGTVRNVLKAFVKEIETNTTALEQAEDNESLG